ncbi:MAG: hydrogenase expression/formation protein HypE, partial [Candidatus Omnitrophica bacterium]|nr:hydrogenase expression/formation protein HypE [Candidatus Omnitrophota bacterium]
PSCPISISDYPNVLLAHGSGGTLMNQLIDGVFKIAFKNKELHKSHDAAVLNIDSSKIAITTDSYVVDPLFFPGGDIGSMAIYGTINDLAMSGAMPIALSVGFILEEGLEMEKLIKVVNSMQVAANKAGVDIVTGDTKVVDSGKGDGIFINTTGIGLIKHNMSIEPSSVVDGDAIIISGDIGRHGIAIMAVREGLEFSTFIESDSAPLNGLVSKLIDSKIEIHCMRDLTRGGLASALVEIAKTSNSQITIDENNIPVREDVRGACEILGFDPMYVANEGRFIAFVKRDDVNKALNIFHSDELGKDAKCIGYVSADKPGSVTMRSCIGTMRVVDMLSGEQLPRIC